MHVEGGEKKSLKRFLKLVGREEVCTARDARARFTVTTDSEKNATIVVFNGVAVFLTTDFNRGRSFGLYAAGKLRYIIDLTLNRDTCTSNWRVNRRSACVENRSCFPLTYAVIYVTRVKPAFSCAFFFTAVNHRHLIVKSKRKTNND